LLESLQQRSAQAGAVLGFVGLVRDFNQAGRVSQLFLEHYPGMTEKVLAAIEQEACARWPLLAVEIVHRFGALAPTEPIVFVGVCSAHRAAAFEGCAYIMDQLKTRAPFWKKELDGEDGDWVEARAEDQQAAQRWDA
jgi:molybdopterin synthase catalytic subunit